jgi:photosystem II stability/assembly factor-like uncharacterized protein
MAVPFRGGVWVSALLGMASCEASTEPSTTTGVGTTVSLATASAEVDSVQMDDTGPTPEAATACGWRTQNSGTKDPLAAVSFVDATHGWAVGDLDILVTSDGGATWTHQDPGSLSPNVGFRGVSFVDADHGWIVGADFQPQDQSNVILVTSDGGQTWTQQSSGIIGFFSTITFIDTLHGWAGGDTAVSGSAAIVSTTDGGVTWVAQPTPLGIVEGISFADPSHGWVVGFGDIAATTNGGALWTTQFSDGTGLTMFTAVHFADANHGWAVGESGGPGPGIFGTTDGATWMSQQSGVPTSDIFLGVTSVDAQHAWAVGGVAGTDDSLVLATQDGATWSAETVPAEASTLNGVSFVDATHGWAVGEFGIIIACLPLLPTKLHVHGHRRNLFSDTFDLEAKLSNASVSPPSPIAGETVSLTLGGETCSAVTDAAGKASCTVVDHHLIGIEIVKGQFAGDNIYEASRASGPVDLLGFAE